MFLKEIEKKLQNNKKYAKAKNELLSDSFYRVGRMIYETRIIHEMTQKELAEKLKTKQPVIASIEKGNKNISLGYLEKIAKIFKTSLIPPQFESLKKIEDKYNKQLFDKCHSDTAFINLDSGNVIFNRLNQANIKFKITSSMENKNYSQF